MRLILSFFLIFSCLYLKADTTDYSSIEKIIEVHFKALQSNDLNPAKENTYDQIHEGLSLAIEIKMKGCISKIDPKVIPHIIYPTILSKTDIISVKKTFKCLELHGFNPEEHFNVMIGLLPHLREDHIRLKFFYNKYYKRFKPHNSSILGLLDIAKLACNEEATSYLKSDGYPPNIGSSMTSKQYFLFDKYLQNVKCVKRIEQIKGVRLNASKLSINSLIMLD